MKNRNSGHVNHDFRKNYFFAADIDRYSAEWDTECGKIQNGIGLSVLAKREEDKGKSEISHINHGARENKGDAFILCCPDKPCYKMGKRNHDRREKRHKYDGLYQ